MHSFLSATSYLMASPNGIVPCDESSTLQFPEQSISLKSQQADGLFYGTILWIQGKCTESVETWRRIYGSGRAGDLIWENAVEALAAGYAELHDWERALYYLRQTDSPRVAETFGHRAAANGELELAAHWFRLNFEIYPSYKNAVYLANVLVPLGHQTDTSRIWQSLAKSTSKNSSEYWLAIAKAAEIRDDCPETVSAYREALQLDPEHLDAMMGLAGMFRHCKDYSAAFEWYLHAAEKDPGNVYIWSHVGIVAYENGDLVNAKIYLEKSVGIQPSALAYDHLSRVAYDQGDIELAIQYLTSALKLEERSGLYLRLGDLYLAQGSIGDAEQAFRRSLELEPENNPASERLGSLLAQ